MPKLEWAGHKWLVTSDDTQMRIVLCCGTAALQIKDGHTFCDVAFGKVIDGPDLAWTTEYQPLEGITKLRARDLYLAANTQRKLET